METATGHPDAHTLEALAERAELADRDAAWPVDSWRALTTAGVPAWSVPREFGGAGAAWPKVYETIRSASARDSASPGR